MNQLDTPTPRMTVFDDIDLGEYPDSLVSQLVEGLGRDHKFVPAEFLYDEEGSLLFDEFVDSKEYYLPKKEVEILQKYSRAVAEHLGSCDIYELGSGTGKKTKILLRAFIDDGHDISYLPIDINRAIMERGAKDLLKALPTLPIHCLAGSYAKVLPALPARTRRRLVLYLGSSISQEEDDSLIELMRKSLGPGDCVFVAYDLKKSPQIIVSAYSNKEEEKISKNVLTHLNRVFKGNFDEASFDLYVAYDQGRGCNATYLRSRRAQTATLEKLSLKVELRPEETITTGVQRKFDHQQISDRFGSAGFRLIERFTDEEGWYAIALFKAI